MTKTHNLDMDKLYVDYLIDSHCHLHNPWFSDLNPIITRAKANNVKHIINCASDPRNFNQVLASTSHHEISGTTNFD